MFVYNGWLFLEEKVFLFAIKIVMLEESDLHKTRFIN